MNNNFLSNSSLKLVDYISTVLDENKECNVLLVAPTGTGKTGVLNEVFEKNKDLRPFQGYMFKFPHLKDKKQYVDECSPDIYEDNQPLYKNHNFIVINIENFVFNAF